MMDIIEHKNHERKKFLLLRDKLSVEVKREYDEALNKKLIKELKMRSVKSLHVYLPMRSEPNIYPFIEHALKLELTVVCPKSLPGGKMENYVLTSLQQVEKGIYGTSYPKDSIQYEGEYDLIVVPGLAYNNQNYRLGYGGGYYDRFLAKNNDSFKLAIAYPFQVNDSLPFEDHDIKVDQVIVP